MGQPFLQPLRHEREFGSLHRCDLRTPDDHLDAQGLTNGDAAGGFVHNQTGVAVSLPGFDGVAKVVRRHFAVRIEDIRQQLFLPAVARSGQIRPDRKPLVVQAMAGLTTLLEQHLATLGVAAQIERGTKTPDYFIAIGVCRCADHLDGALLEQSVRMLS